MITCSFIRFQTRFTGGLSPLQPQRQEAGSTDRKQWKDFYPKLAF
ncbi:hypothetical protein [Fodinibius roseus]|nr:hypothetical protein [Fodinibius roseus]